MKIALTGASGLVGRFIAEAALAAGHELTLLGRKPPAGMAPRPGLHHAAYDLTAAPPPLDGQEALVHCAFAHLPGLYRGGEGSDPEGFLAANRDGSLALFAAARAAGVRQAVFLSSRAVYGDYPPGTPLVEAMAPRPDTLYGAMKAEVEAGLAALSGPGFTGSSLRATGVYGPAGPGQRHKWADLFAAFRDGCRVAPRVATELHGADLARAVLCLLDAPAPQAAGAFNASDLTLDRRDLLAEVARLTGWQTALPARADAGRVNAMACDRLAALGWAPGGWPLLRASLPELLAGL